MKRILSFILIATYFLLPNKSFAQNVQYIGTKDNIVVTRNISRDDTAHEFALTDTSKHPLRPGRMISFNGSPYWWNGIFWYRLNGDTSTVPGQVNADWTSVSGVSLILHKPTLATVATSGSYLDLTNQPTIPAAQVATDWNAVSGITQIINKPRMVDSVYRVVGKDSFFIVMRRPNGTLVTYSVKDSTGGTGASGVTIVSTGNLSPLFTANFSNPTSTPALSFTLNNAPAHGFWSNTTGSPAQPAYSSITLADLPAIPLANTNAANGYGILPIVSGSIAWDSSKNYPRFNSVLRPSLTDSVYYKIQTGQTTFTTTLAYIDSIRLSAKGATSAFTMAYQTGPSTFYNRKVRAGTNMSITTDTDSTLAFSNALTTVVNSLQVINTGGGHGYGSGLLSARPSGTTGDLYYATDNGILYYFNGTSWVSVVSGAPSNDTVRLVRVGTGAFPLYSSAGGDTLYQTAFKNSSTISFTKNSDSTISATSLLAGANSVNITGANVSLVNDIASGTLKLYGFDASSVRNYITFSSLPVTSGTTNGLFPYQYKNRADSNLAILNDRFYPLLDSFFVATPTLDTLLSKRFELVQGTGVTITNNSDIHKNSYTITSTNSGGSPNSNVGAQYRWAIPNTNNIKTATAGTGIGIDSITTNQLNFSIDPLIVATLTNVQTLTNKTLVSPKLNTTSTATYVWTATDNLGNGSWQPATTGYVNPMTTLGDMVYENGTPVATRLPGNITTVPQVLWQTGTGSVSAAPVWHTLTKADIGLGNVENTALSTWPGTANVNTVGTVTTGTWNATTVDAAHGGTGKTTYVPYAVVAGGTTSTGALQQVSGVGASLQALISNGASTLPTWQGVVNSLTGTTNEVAFNFSSGNITASTPQPIAPTSNVTFNTGTFNGTLTANGSVFTPSFIAIANPTQDNLYFSNAANGAGFQIGRSTANNNNNDFYIFDGAAAQNRLTISQFGKVTIPDTLQIQDGNQGAGKVLTSDASGNGTWQTPSSGGITANNGLTLTGSNVAIGGQLVSNTVIGGGTTSHSLQLGDALGNTALTAFTVVTNNDISLSSGSGNVSFLSQPKYLIGAANGGGNITLNNSSHFIELATLSANRTITLPTPGSSTAGQVYTLINENTSGTFSWSFASTVKDAAGSTITTLTNGTTYQIVCTQTNWVKYN